MLDVRFTEAEGGGTSSASCTAAGADGTEEVRAKYTHWDDLLRALRRHVS